ncbi:hypothetical protein [Sphingomonas colocasiae]|uniref:GIY-YIG nuclease family protein n=1 Tax=Sphingomonas colocasiae TaxID=1848973 RepID=A0ABS7PRA8_9SPHN|nr:hypothetical protein [Sphingomonas colocasiae]MBY8823791.1 hypothetical protein [Sphingomonas colocasiae]
MAAPHGFKPADLGGEPNEFDCKPAFRPIEIDWSKPKPWGPSNEIAPISGAQQKPGYLYAISWDHQSAHHRETIAYIGITKNLASRFENHPSAEYLRSKKRKTFLSIGHIDFGRIVNASARTKLVTEELEHILIWALWPTLENVNKIMCIPGHGKNRGGAWHITNTGHRFRGRMPREIIYPWMLVKPGRDRSRK